MTDERTLAEFLHLLEARRDEIDGLIQPTFENLRHYETRAEEAGVDPLGPSLRSHPQYQRLDDREDFRAARTLFGSELDAKGLDPLQRAKAELSFFVAVVSAKGGFKLAPTDKVVAITEAAARLEKLLADGAWLANERDNEQLIVLVRRLILEQANRLTVINPTQRKDRHRANREILHRLAFDLLLIDGMRRKTVVGIVEEIKLLLDEPIPTHRSIDTYVGEMMSRHETVLSRHNSALRKK